MMGVVGTMGVAGMIGVVGVVGEVGMGKEGVPRFGTTITGLGERNMLAGVNGVFCWGPGSLGCGLLGVMGGENNPGNWTGAPLRRRGVKTGVGPGVANLATSTFSVWFTRVRWTWIGVF